MDDFLDLLTYTCPFTGSLRCAVANALHDGLEPQSKMPRTVCLISLVDVGSSYETAGEGGNEHCLINGLVYRSCDLCWEILCNCDGLKFVHAGLRGQLRNAIKAKNPNMSADPWSSRNPAWRQLVVNLDDAKLKAPQGQGC